ncbi:MAG: hemerythrin domain-containing protein [Acidiferrobacterales bacterium]|nr:hemerythrin domain-containing protein [Acidiferrobacterales bacterium]
MQTVSHVGAADPIANLLEYVRELEHACACLEGEAVTGWSEAIRFMDARTPLYLRDLEQAVLPLLKKRLRDDSEDEAALAQTLIRLAGELAEIDARWRALRPALASAGAARSNPKLSKAIAEYVGLWEAHVEVMENDVIPALHARLGRVEMDSLARALALHRGVSWGPQDADAERP